MNRNDRIRFRNLAYAWLERAEQSAKLSTSDSTPDVKLRELCKGLIFKRCAEELQVLLDASNGGRVK
jgi:hypothetical protein